MWIWDQVDYNVVDLCTSKTVVERTSTLSTPQLLRM